MGPRGVFRVLDAAGELPALRRPGRPNPVGCGKTSADQEVPVVPGEVGAAAVAAGGGGRVWNELAEYVCGGEDGGGLGAQSSENDGNHGGWDR